MMKIILLLILLFCSCREHVTLPSDLEDRGITSTPSNRVEITIDYLNEIHFEVELTGEIQLDEIFASISREMGKSTILIFRIDNQSKLKEINRIMKIAGLSKLDRFAIRVKESNGFENLRRFRSISQSKLKNTEKSKEKIFFEDENLTIQELINFVSSEKNKLPVSTNYTYYLVYED